MMQYVSFGWDERCDARDKRRKLRKRVDDSPKEYSQLEPGDVLELASGERVTVTGRITGTPLVRTVGDSVRPHQPWCLTESLAWHYVGRYDALGLSHERRTKAGACGGEGA